MASTTAELHKHCRKPRFGGHLPLTDVVIHPSEVYRYRGAIHALITLITGVTAESLELDKE